MTIKKGEFVELEFTAKLKESGEIFDTTDENLAKEHDLFSKRMEYGPIIVCVGEGMVLHGFDLKLEGLNGGKHQINLTQDEAFGRKSAKLIQLIPTKKFTKEGIKRQNKED